MKMGLDLVPTALTKEEAKLAFKLYPASPEVRLPTWPD